MVLVSFQSFSYRTLLHLFRYKHTLRLRLQRIFHGIETFFRRLELSIKSDLLRGTEIGVAKTIERESEDNQAIS